MRISVTPIHYLKGKAGPYRLCGLTGHCPDQQKCRPTKKTFALLRDFAWKKKTKENYSQRYQFQRILWFKIETAERYHFLQSKNWADLLQEIYGYLLLPLLEKEFLSY